MRKITLQMMTTLNGRLDDPFTWFSGIEDDLYQEVDRLYASFDTELVGRTTYEEMFAYWPGARNEGTETNRRMANRMHENRKVVFSRRRQETPLRWHHSEWAITPTDAELVRYVQALKEAPGGGIHLAGGAELARTFVRLGLVDEYRLFVHPVVSDGASWFGAIADQRALELIDARPFRGGVVAMAYRPKAPASAAQPRPQTFTELIR